MAKSNLSWSMKVNEGNKIIDSKIVVEILAIKEKVTFDLEKLFKDFMKFSQCQMRIIANGVKQKLADDIAKPADVKLTPQEMKVELKALWDRLVEGNWFKIAHASSTKKVAELKEELVEQAVKLTETEQELANAKALIEKLTKKS